MSGMTKVDREGPYPSSMKNNGVTVDTLVDGGGSDSTEVVAVAADKQHHIIGGHFSAGAAATLTIYSNATVIGLVELAAAGTVPIPPVYTAAGEALKMANTDDVASIFVYVESQPVKSGVHAPLTE